MKARHLSLVALALIVTPSLVGCGQEAATTAPSLSDSNVLNTESVQGGRPGKKMFDDAQAEAMASLSLSEIVLLTPYITGARTIENATLAEITQITPVIIKFQDAFSAALSTLSLGDLVRVTRYMVASGKNKSPWPVLDGSSGVAL